MLALQPDDPRRVGPYQLLGRLGAGGMGQVYLAAGPAGPAAVKIVHRALAKDHEFRSRFRREIAHSRHVTGPWAAALLDADPDATIPWLATEYVPGPSLDHAVQAAGPLPLDAVLRMATGLSRALTDIHAAGLVHRDVKPSNVLLAADGPRLIDLGIARAADGTQVTATGAVIGTPAFMSPEQAEGTALGPASDVFSLAGVLVYAATGRSPFGDADPFVLLLRIVDDPPDLSGIAGQLRVTVAACLAKRPEDRPSTAAAAAAFASMAVPPAPGWLPAPIAAMDPTPRSMEQTVAGAGTRIGHTAIRPSPTAPRRMSRRGLLVGVAALGATMAAGAGAAVYLGSRLASDLTATPAVPSAPPAPPAVPPAAPAEAAARWTFTELPKSSDMLAGIDALVVVDGVLYVGGAGGAVAIDAATGAQRWSFQAPPGGTGFSPNAVNLAVADGTVYVATRGMLTALDQANGGRRWETALEATTAYGSSVGIGVNAGGGSAYATIGNRLIAYDGSGRTRWEHTVEGNFAASPVLDGTRCLVADGASVDALDVATANVLWRHRTGSPNATDLAVADGTVYLGVNLSPLTALDAATGAPRWDGAVGAKGIDPKGPPVVVDGVAVVLGRDELLHALDVGTGKERWAYPDRAAGGGIVNAAPAAAGQLVYSAGNNGRVYAVEAATGARRWVYSSADFRPSVVAAAGTTVFAADSSSVRAIEAAA